MHARCVDGTLAVPAAEDQSRRDDSSYRESRIGDDGRVVMFVRRVASVLDFEFWPLRGTGRALSWSPAATTVLAAVSAIVGVALGIIWLALAGATAMLGLFFIALYRPDRQVIPGFPRHQLDIGHPWVAVNPSANGIVGDDKLLIFDVAYSNLEPERHVNLTIDALWTRDVGDRPLGPYKLSRHLGQLGRLTPFPHDAALGPQERVEGAAAFVGWIPGVELGDHGSDFEAPDYIRLEIRLTDNISNAEHVERLPVAGPLQDGDDR